MTKEAGLQLAKHFSKTEYQLQNPGITDTVLIANAKWTLSQLELEREAARCEQGYPERVQDWWAAPTMVGKKKRKKGKKIGKKIEKMIGTKHRAKADQTVSVEGLGDEINALRLGDEEMEEEKGGGLLKGEAFEGFETPVMMSPVGSVVGNDEEKESG